MSKFLLNTIPPILFWGIFSLVIFQIPYPDSLIKANLVQISLFFFPLYLALFLTLNIFLKNFPLSASISLGLISLLILQSLDTLNLITSLLVLMSTGLLVSYFRKIRRGSLTSEQKIPKLHTMRKQK